MSVYYNPATEEIGIYGPHWSNGVGMDVGDFFYAFSLRMDAWIYIGEFD